MTAAGWEVQLSVKITTSLPGQSTLDGSMVSYFVLEPNDIHK